jgi:hypothetical protein
MLDIMIKLILISLILISTSACSGINRGEIDFGGKYFVKISINIKTLNKKLLDKLTSKEYEYNAEIISKNYKENGVDVSVKCDVVKEGGNVYFMRIDESCDLSINVICRDASSRSDVSVCNILRESQMSSVIGKGSEIIINASIP